VLVGRVHACVGQLGVGVPSLQKWEGLAEAAKAQYTQAGSHGQEWRWQWGRVGLQRVHTRMRTHQSFLPQTGHSARDGHKEQDASGCRGGNPLGFQPL